jgi:hypothetical protein
MRGGRRWTVGRQLNAFRLDSLALLFLSLYSEEFFVVDGGGIGSLDAGGFGEDVLFSARCA